MTQKLIFNVYEAKAKLSEIITRVINGEEIIIAKNKQPLVMIVPYLGQRRKLGALGGKVWMADDFDAALDPDTLAAFEGDR